MSAQETGAWFHTTSWALVVGARADRGDLELLLRAYWSPVYAFVRKKGFSPHDAADLTQEFLAEVLIGRNLISKADQSRGRFRSFLKAALTNFLIDHRRKVRSKKAMPDAGIASMDALSGGSGGGGGGGGVAVEPESRDEPANAFDRQWAAAVLALTIERVESSCKQEGLDQQWTAFRINVLSPMTKKTRPMSMERLAETVGATGPEQASNMIQTVKRRFKRMLRQVVSETVSDPEQVEDELASLKTFFQ